MLTVAVLGPVEVRRDGVLLPMPPGKSTEVLVRLAVAGGRPVRAGTLLADLWPGAPARNTLQVKVSKLRRALGDPGAVTGGPDGYRLHADAVDVADDRAVAAFRGGFLPAAGDWAEPYRADLAERRVRAAERDGDPAGLLDDYPLRESLWARHIALLHEAGRDGDALSAYEKIRRTLRDELGADPGPVLRAQHRGILRPPRAGNLPVLANPLIGRRDDLAAIGDAPLTTIVGPAGVGKTRLAIERGRREPAAWIAHLQTGTVWTAIGEAFGLAEPAVLDRLRTLDALLILDNCEHLLDELPPVIARILAEAPGIRILATSQVPLGLDGEVVHELRPLPPAAAAELFLARAARRHHDPAAVEALCRALDGLPLALELAAARTRALGVAEIHARLDDRFAVLREVRGSGRRTLEAALDWSYGLLPDPDQRGLQALSVFTGGASLAAAQDLMSTMDVNALDVLDRLVDRSLVVAEADAAGAVRYRLLESVRAYGRDRLRESGRWDAVADAHAAFFAGLARAAAPGLRGPDQSQNLFIVRSERSNLDSAIARLAPARSGAGVRMALDLAWAWVFLGAGADRATLIRGLLTPDMPLADRAEALLFTGWFESTGGDLDRALADIHEAIDLAPEVPRGQIFLAFVHSQAGRPGDVLAALTGVQATGWEAGAAWLLRAWAEIALGRVDVARKACDEALRLLDDDWALGHAEALLGGLAQAEHRYADAVAHLRRATDASVRLGFAATGALHRTNLGRARQLAGDPDGATADLERAIASAQEAGDLRVAALAHTRLARVLRAAGRDDDARAHVTVARRWYATAGGGDGSLLADHLAAALDDDRDALERIVARHDPETEALSLDALARIAAADGRVADATALLREADSLVPAHLVTEADRLDKHQALRLDGGPR